MKTSPFDLNGQDVWVIGGAGYLGQSVVKLLAAQGATVLCADLGTKAQEAGLGERVTPATLDARDLGAVDQFVAEHVASRGVPQALVVMTYGASGKRFEDLTAEDFDQANQGNLTSTFALTRAVGQRMAEAEKGSIVLFSSMYGTVSPEPAIYEPPMNPNPIEYGVGKAGIQQMARYLAVHWGPKNVRCNSVSPGPFPNPSIQRDHPAFIERLSRKVPMQRVGQADEMAGVVAFLVSDASTYLTGQNLAVDGGWTSW